MKLRWKGTRAQLKQALADLPGQLAGTKPDPLGLGKIMLGEIGFAVQECVYEAFLTKSRGGTGSDGVTWAPLKESTLARREAKGVVHGRVLEETSDLLRSLLPVSPDPDSPRPAGQVFEVAPGSVTIGSDDRTADKHQHGTTYMPARPIVPDGDLPAAWSADMEAAFERGLAKVLEKLCSGGP